jgi:hypothetical protein
MNSKGPQPQKFDKLKDLPSDAVPGKDFEMAGLSYKKGDLACPDDVMPTLLGLPNNAPSSGDFKVWTWGNEHDFYNYIVDVKKYYPAYAIYLAK